MEFLKAIRGNDYKKVDKKLKKGLNVNDTIEEYDKKGVICVTIPLCVAAARGYSQIAELLMSYGANIHASNADWSSPMHTATFHGHLEIIRLLLARRVNLNNRDQHGNTCLHLAVNKSNVEAVVMLVNNYVDTEVRNSEGKTALDIATEFQFTRIIKILGERRSEIQVQIKTAPAPAPKPQRPSIESEKEKLKQQLQDLELKEVNVEIRKKQAHVLKVTTDIQDGETEATKIKTQISTLEKKLKEINQSLLANETIKTKLNVELLSLGRKKSKTVSKDANSPNEDAFECPICFTLPLPPKQVYQCENGHIYCSDCKDKPTMSKCPQCRIPLKKESAIRNLMYEEIINDVFT